MPARLISVAALGLWLSGCSVYEPSLLDGAISAPLSSAGDSGVAGATSGGAQGSAGLTGDSAGSTATAGDGSSGGSAGEAGASDFGGASAGGTGGTAAGGDASGGASAGSSGAGASAAGSGGSLGAAGAGGSAPVLVELASGKKSVASSYQAGNENAKGNDKDLTTKWCASTGTFPQWWRVDLGATHSLSNFTVTWEHPDRTYTYKIETSQNDSVYAVQASLSGTGSVQSDSFPANTTARYVRVTVTDGAPATYMGVTYPTWACFFELSITGT
jgi:hypothetical protein